MGDWYKIIICAKCEKRMSHDEKMYSDGVCKYCGYDNNSTVCKTIGIIAKEIKHHKWWQFWKRKYTYIGKDEFSQNWLDKH